MEWKIILEVIILGIGLSMDAFTVSICDGLIYRDLNKRKALFIAGDFGFMQAAMPLIGFFIADLFLEYVENYIPWISFALLLIIGGKMIFDAIKEMKEKRKNPEHETISSFSYKEVLLAGVATSIDALATGVTMAGMGSTKTTIWLHAFIICCITFCFCILGLFLGKTVNKLLKDKYLYANIAGGVILILLGVYIVTSHYLGI